jgi:CxxC-x17-CxxC domain-containing protein
MSTYADKALRCVSCGADFTFTAREQEFHATKGFTNEPRRCLACRQARRGSPAGTADGRSQTSSPQRGGAARGAAAPAAERRTYAAVCSACGGEASLPFEPVGNRPVLCTACYDKIRTRA